MLGQLNKVRLGYVMLVQVWFCYAWSGKVRPGYARIWQVM